MYIYIYVYIYIDTHTHIHRYTHTNNICTCTSHTQAHIHDKSSLHVTCTPHTQMAYLTYARFNFDHLAESFADPLNCMWRFGGHEHLGHPDFTQRNLFACAHVCFKLEMF